MSFDAVRWWLAPAMHTAETWAAVNERVLAELVGLVVRGFEGQVLRVQVGGRPLRAVLEELRLDHPRGRVVLRDVDWDGWPFVMVAARARSLRVERLPPPRVTAIDVEVIGTSALTPLVTWLDSLVAGWSLRIGSAGHLQARRGPFTAILEATVANHDLRLELRGVAWRRAHLQLPRRLRPRRRVALPPLPHGLSVLHAHRRDDVVDFRLTLPSVRLPG